MAVNNNVILIGRLTKDIDLRKTSTGLSVTQFTLAVNGRNKEQQADFISCVAWKQSAEYLYNYAKKGSLIALNGRISTRNYQSGQGQTVYVTEVVAEQVTILATAAQPQHNHSTTTVQQDHGSDADNFFNVELDISEDDLPF